MHIQNVEVTIDFVIQFLVLISPNSFLEKLFYPSLFFIFIHHPVFGGAVERFFCVSSKYNSDWFYHASTKRGFRSGF